MRNKLEADPLTAPVVCRMFEMASKNMGCKEIAKTLNYEGCRTGNGERWGRVTVHKVLTNEAYCGTLVWGGRPGHLAARAGGSPVRVENAWPAIVDKDTFHLVQRKMSSNSPRAAHPRTVPSFYLLSGVMFCACGRAMVGNSAKSHRNYYYVCSRSAKQGKEACGSRMLPKVKLERLVIDELKSRVLTDENLEQLVMLVNDDLRLRLLALGTGWTLSISN